MDKKKLQILVPVKFEHASLALLQISFTVRSQRLFENEGRGVMRSVP
jgi:hypothetical protein